VSTDRNYTDARQSGANTGSERVGDITGEPPINKAVDKGKASRLANLLEGLEFPATKEEIMNHINQRPPDLGNNVLEAIKNNLVDNTKYGSNYEVEVAADLVERAVTEKPYVRDRALNRANRKRIGESSRPDPYSGREIIKPANARDVSPNTPPGEDI
jgi:hypothetical protein